MEQEEANDTGLDLAAIGGRVKQMISLSGGDGTVFAAEAGVAYSTMRSYLSGSRAPSAEFLTAVYKTHGFLPSWVLTGDEPARMSDLLIKKSDLEDNFVSIPLLPVQVSAGHGVLNEPAAEYRVSSGLCFSRQWLAMRGLSPTQLKVIEVRGSSMDGVLSHGDRVLVDMGDTKPRSGFVYVLRQDDELLVKYCQLLPGGMLRVSSANTEYAAYDVDLEKNPNVAVVGRVVASMHEW